MSETVTAGTTPISSIPGLVAGTYAIDTNHSEIGFTVRHLMTKVRGTFKEYAGEIVVKDSLEESTANVTVELASVDTRSEQRDGHLRSGDFFDAENHPKMTFASTALTPNGDDYTLAGCVANGLYRLFGDVNGDGVVNATDFAQFRSRFGAGVP